MKLSARIELAIETKKLSLIKYIQSINQDANFNSVFNYAWHINLGT